jgi:hypothetical protein
MLFSHFQPPWCSMHPWLYLFRIQLAKICKSELLLSNIDAAFNQAWESLWCLPCRGSFVFRAAVPCNNVRKHRAHIILWTLRRLGILAKCLENSRQDHIYLYNLWVASWALLNWLLNFLRHKSAGSSALKQDFNRGKNSPVRSNW